MQSAPAALQRNDFGVSLQRRSKVFFPHPWPALFHQRKYAGRIKLEPVRPVILTRPPQRTRKDPCISPVLPAVCFEHRQIPIWDTLPSRALPRPNPISDHRTEPFHESQRLLLLLLLLLLLPNVFFIAIYFITIYNRSPCSTANSRKAAPSS